MTRRIGRSFMTGRIGGSMVRGSTMVGVSRIYNTYSTGTGNMHLPFVLVAARHVNIPVGGGMMGRIGRLVMGRISRRVMSRPVPVVVGRSVRVVSHRGVLVGVTRIQDTCGAHTRHVDLTLVLVTARNMHLHA